MTYFRALEKQETSQAPNQQIKENKIRPNMNEMEMKNSIKNKESMKRGLEFT